MSISEFSGRHSESREDHRPSAVGLFDVDNTLIDGFSVFMFADHLVGSGLFSPEARRRMTEDYERFKSGETDYRGFAIEVVDNYSLGLGGQRQDDIRKAGEGFVDTYKKHLLPHSEALVGEMKKHADVLIAVSGAPLEAFSPLAQELGIDGVNLLEAEVVDGIYTGRTGINMALDEQKLRTVDLFRNTIDFSRSFAFGDSIHDLPILEAVGNPFVVGNRDSQLAELAQSRNWPRVDSASILDQVAERLSSLKQS